MRRNVSTRTSVSLLALSLLAASCGPANADRLRELLGLRPGSSPPILSLRDDYTPPPPPPKTSQSALDAIIFGPSQNTPLMDLDRPVRPWGPPPHDMGGFVRDYVAKVRAVGAARIEIRGSCVSSCTIFLGAQNVCVDRRAMLWFHAAHDRETRQISAEGNRMLAAYWPKPVQDWAKMVRAQESVDFTLRRALTGVELHAMGLPDCR